VLWTSKCPQGQAIELTGTDPMITRQGSDSPLPETLTLNFSEEKPERE